MRKLIYTFALVIMLAVVTPAQAQYRNAEPHREAPVRVYDEGSSFALNKLFSPEHFRMSHSYELSYGSMGGSGLSLGTYTNTMQWQFNSKLAARADIAFTHTPFGTGDFQQAFGGQNSYGKIYLRNAEVMYRPTENSALHLSFRQSPYGGYMNPYGYGSYRDPYGYYGGPGYYGYEQGLLFDASYSRHDPFRRSRVR